MSVRLNSRSFGKERKAGRFATSPLGAGDSNKAPLIDAWQDKSFTPEEVLKFDGLRCVGMRCGPDAGGLVAIT